VIIFQTEKSYFSGFNNRNLSQKILHNLYSIRGRKGRGRTERNKGNKRAVKLTLEAIY
jgi:hypothetical protein